MKIEVVELKKGMASLEAMKFLAPARSNDVTRAVLNLIHIEQSEKPDAFIAVATDGRRLHAEKIEGAMEPGEYRIVKSTPSYMMLVQDATGNTYPKWQGVVPTFKSNEMKKLTLIYDKLNIGVRSFKLACEIHALKKVIFNMNYVIQATQNMSSCYVYQQDEFSPLVIQDSANDWKILAVIMPTRKD